MKNQQVILVFGFSMMAASFAFADLAPPPLAPSQLMARPPMQGKMEHREPHREPMQTPQAKREQHREHMQKQQEERREKKQAYHQQQREKWQQHQQKRQEFHKNHAPRPPQAGPRPGAPGPH